MLTQIAKPFFKGRQRKIAQYATLAEEIQRGVLARLVTESRDTVYGARYDFNSLRDYADFAAKVPLNDYESLKADIHRMRGGEKNILCPGRVKWFAKSSGTTSDKSKFIPVSDKGLQSIHYQGGTDVVALYLQNNPGSRIFDGRALILGGSFDKNPEFQGISHSGDLSAILIGNINPAVNLVRVPKKGTALLSDFEEKRDRIAREALHKNVTNLSGVPSWMMSVVNRVLELAGTDNLADVWPNLEVFFHGGVAFTPYRSQYQQLIRSSKMHYMETYNASEGFFGIQNDPSDAAMLLMIDYDVFYEFIPMDEVAAEPVPLWEVETGRNYAMVITTNCGLWRYQIGDTVRFTSTKPYKFVITGRTKCFINAFGEELMVDNAEKGLLEACRQTGAEVRDYTAAPVFMDAEGQCRHQWLVDFAKMPEDVEKFAEILDGALQKINSDYEAKRFKNLTLQRLELIVACPGLFDEWLKSKGKLGGQHKVPRLANDRKIIDEILKINTEK